MHNNNKNNHNNISTDELTSEQRDKLNNLLNKHAATFENNHSTTSVYTHEIKVTDENKFVRKTYTNQLHYQKRVDEEIKKMLDSNIIESSNSNFLNPMVIVKKKNNQISICLDMRN